MLSPATLQFARQHREADVQRLALQGSKNPEVSLSDALTQIAGWQTARRKLPAWAAQEGLLYPPHLSMEQCSSEQAARYKAALARRLLATGARADGQETTLADLTGGLGVDFSFLAPCFGSATYVERQPHLCRLARHNLPLLGVRAQVVEADAAGYLERMEPVTMLFLDPARRDDHGGRIYSMAQSEPDVLALRGQLLDKAHWVVLKLSPMLDWRKAVSDLGQPSVREVHVVAVGGECKELLLVLSREGQGLTLHCWSDGQELTEQIAPAAEQPMPAGEQPMPAAELTAAVLPAEAAETASWRYLYEPNAAVMKAGCFAAVQRQFGARPIAANSHLFVSAQPVERFPGRSFCIEALSTMNKRELKARLGHLRQANITVRNFPLTVAQLRQRLKISEGGSNYLFATTLASGQHVLLLCRKA